MRNRFLQCIVGIVLAAALTTSLCNAAARQNSHIPTSRSIDVYNSWHITVVQTSTPLPGSTPTSQASRSGIVHPPTLRVAELVQQELNTLGLSRHTLAQYICKASGDTRSNGIDITLDWLKTIFSGRKASFSTYDIDRLSGGLTYTLTAVQKQRKLDELRWNLKRAAGIDPIPGSPLEPAIKRLFEVRQATSTFVPTQEVGSLMWKEMDGLRWTGPDLAQHICEANQNTDAGCTKTYEWLKTIYPSSTKKPHLNHEDIERLVSGLTYGLPLAQKQHKLDELRWNLRRAAGLDPLPGSPLEYEIDQLVKARFAEPTANPAPKDASGNALPVPTPDAAQKPAPPAEQPNTPLPVDTPSEDASETPQASAEQPTYVVQLGDTLILIAKHYYGDPAQWPQIYRANAPLIGPDPDLIRPGQQLVIPMDVPVIVAPEPLEVKSADISLEAPEELPPFIPISSLLPEVSADISNVTGDSLINIPPTRDQLEGIPDPTWPEINVPGGEPIWPLPGRAPYIPIVEVPLLP